MILHRVSSYYRVVILVFMTYFFITSKRDLEGVSIMERFQIQNVFCQPSNAIEGERLTSWSRVVKDSVALVGKVNDKLKKRILVTYYYYEKPNDRETYKKTLQFFYDHGLIRSDFVDFVIVFQGKDPHEMDRVQRCEQTNVVYTRKKGMCAWYESFPHALEVAPRAPEDYTHFIFINASVRGPYVSTHDLPYLDPEYGWTELLTNLITDQVKLGGITLSCEIQLHVQSMVLVTDTIGLEVLSKAGLISSCETCERCPLMKTAPSKWVHWCRKNVKNHVVCNCEIGMSQELLQNTEFGIGALSSGQSRAIFRENLDEFCKSGMEGGSEAGSHAMATMNPWMKGGWYDSFPVAYDALFWKASHGIQKDILETTERIAYRVKGCNPGHCCKK